jgi:hypothetical protein
MDSNQQITRQSAIDRGRVYRGAGNLEVPAPSRRFYESLEREAFDAAGGSRGVAERSPLERAGLCVPPAPQNNPITAREHFAFERERGS